MGRGFLPLCPAMYYLITSCAIRIQKRNEARPPALPFLDVPLSPMLAGNPAFSAMTELPVTQLQEEEATKGPKPSSFKFLNTAGQLAKGGLSLIATGADLAVGTAAGVATYGVTNFMETGRGFRDFVLRSNVVELAVAVVFGMAFTSLINALTQDIITPFIAAIFAGTHFNQLSFTINQSVFMYGDFINALLVFVIIVAVLYFGVVMPLEKLMYSVYKNKALTKDCPHCLEEICLVATRCKFCCGEIEVPQEELDEMKALVEQTAAAKSCSWLPWRRNKAADQQQQAAMQLLSRAATMRVHGRGGSVTQLPKVYLAHSSTSRSGSVLLVKAATSSLSPAGSFKSLSGDCCGDVEAPSLSEKPAAS